MVGLKRIRITLVTNPPSDTRADTLKTMNASSSARVLPGIVLEPQPSPQGWYRQFPNPVNEKAARVTGALVVLLAAVTIATNWWPLYLVATIGFALRVGWGPRFSPFGRISVHLIAPRFGPAKLVAGPPKRFAQAIGLAFTLTALVLRTVGFDGAAQITLGLLIFAAALEAFAGICLGCLAFGFLQRRGVIPESVCVACANFGAAR